MNTIILSFFSARDDANDHETAQRHQPDLPDQNPRRPMLRLEHRIPCRLYRQECPEQAESHPERNEKLLSSVHHGAGGGSYAGGSGMSMRLAIVRWPAALRTELPASRRFERPPAYLAWPFGRGPAERRLSLPQRARANALGCQTRSAMIMASKSGGDVEEDSATRAESVHSAATLAGVAARKGFRAPLRAVAGIGSAFTASSGGDQIYRQSGNSEVISELAVKDAGSHS